MDHRKISLQFLRTSGMTPIRVRPRQKDTFPEWDPRNSPNEDPLLTLKILEENSELNIGAHFYGKYVDVDVDTDVPEVYVALEYFLPKTPHVWGRPAKRKSHRVYALHADFDRGQFSGMTRFLKGLKIGERNYSIEIRGGNPSNAMYAVMPGSIHPSGEPYEWDTDVDPTVSPTYLHIHDLLKQVRLAMAAAILAPYWTEGVRNDMTMALSGLLWRIRIAGLGILDADGDEDVDPTYLVITEDDAERLIDAILRMANDDVGDRRSRLISFKNTWRKLNQDPTSKITGGKVMAEIMGPEGDQIIKAVYRLLSDSNGMEELEALSEQFYVWYGQGVLIDMDMVVKGSPLPWMNKEQVRNSLGDRKIKLGDKKIPIAPLLFTLPTIQRVYGLTFDPSSEERLVDTELGVQINQWRGFATKPCEQQVKATQVAMFTDYVREVLACGNEEVYHWIMSWCADILQRPGHKPGTALVLVGVEGAGKTFLGEHVLGPIIGDAHAAQVNSISELTDKFNANLDNTLFVQCDEAIHSYQRDVAARLKSIITDKTLKIEPKGINAFHKPNHMRFLFTSNSDRGAIFIDPSPYERRYSVFKVANSKARDIPYWEHMHAWMPTALPLIMRWLLDYKYDRKTIMRPMMSEVKQDIQKVAVDVEVSWILNRIAEGFLLGEPVHDHWWQAFNAETITDNDKENDVKLRDRWPNVVSMHSVEEDLRFYTRGMGRVVYSGSLVTNIKTVLPPNSLEFLCQTSVKHTDPKTGQDSKSRVRLYSFPNEASIIEHLRLRYGDIVDLIIKGNAEGEEDLFAVKEPAYLKKRKF